MLFSLKSKKLNGETRRRTGVQEHSQRKPRGEQPHGSNGLFPLQPHTYAPTRYILHPMHQTVRTPNLWSMNQSREVSLGRCVFPGSSHFGNLLEATAPLQPCKHKEKQANSGFPSYCTTLTKLVPPLFCCVNAASPPSLIFGWSGSSSPARQSSATVRHGVVFINYGVVWRYVVVPPKRANTGSQLHSKTSLVLSALSAHDTLAWRQKSRSMKAPHRIICSQSRFCKDGL